MEIVSNIIGKLKQNKRFSDWWNSKEVKIPFFGNEKLIFIWEFLPEEDKDFINQADRAVANFLKLDLTYRNSISRLVYKNCMDFLNEVGYDEADNHLWQIKNQDEIWDFVEPTKIYVKRRPYKDQDIYIQIACNCDWEQEHGLQLVFKQGKKITRVSARDGHLTEADAYGKPDDEDDLLSKF